MILKIGITGHRQLEYPDIVKAQIKQQFERIKAQNPNATIEAYSALAIGADIIFAEVALEMAATIKVILPFPVEEYQKDFEEKDDLDKFLELLARDQNYKIKINKIPLDKEERNNAYLNTGKRIADECNILIAVWDREPAQGKGGTADIVSYAKSINKEVIIVKAARAGKDSLFKFFDDKAVKYKKQYGYLWKTVLISGLIAALSFSVASSFSEKPFSYYLTCAELIFASIAVICICILKFGKLNYKRLSYRRGAEYLRTMENYFNAGIKIERLESKDELAPEILKKETDYINSKSPKTSFEQKRKYLLSLAEGQFLYHSQKRPELKEKWIIKKLDAVKSFLPVIFIIGVVLHFLSEHLTHKQGACILGVTHFSHWPGLLLSTSIPPIYAAIETLVYFKDYHKIFWDSEKMKYFFEKKIELLKSIAAENEASEQILYIAAEEIRREMDNENRHWLIIMQPKTTPGGM